MFWLLQAMLVYWFTSNAFSLFQVSLLKIPAVRTKLGIEQLVKHPQHLLPKKKGFVQGIKESKYSFSHFGHFWKLNS
jgi:YidC/Oxa1 family membrane protein insertase